MYREAHPEPVDREALALAEVSRHVLRTRKRTMLLSMLVGFALGGVGAWAVLVAQFAAMGRAYAQLCALVGFCGPLLLAFLVGRSWADARVEERLPQWISAAAARFEVPVGPLRELAVTLWR